MPFDQPAVTQFATYIGVLHFSLERHVLIACVIDGQIGRLWDVKGQIHREWLLNFKLKQNQSYFQSSKLSDMIITVFATLELTAFTFKGPYAPTPKFFSAVQMANTYHYIFATRH